MTLATENSSVAFEIDIDGELKRMDMDRLSVLPRIGEIVECNYVHGTKVLFEVTEVHHFLFNSGHDIVQNITIRGKAI